MKTFRCPNCGDKYQLMHICLKKPENNEIICRDCGHLAKDHSDDIGCLFSRPNPNRFSVTTCHCTKSKSDVIYEYYFSSLLKADTCPDCGHETKKHSKCGCMQRITLGNGGVICPCNKPYEISSDRAEAQCSSIPKESGIKCPDCGHDVNWHRDTENPSGYNGCNHEMPSLDEGNRICSCEFSLEDALNKAVEYAGRYSAKAIALRVSYEQNKKPEPQTCVMCDDVFTKSKDIEAGIRMATPGHSIRFVCKSCCMFIYFGIRNREERL